MVQLKIKGYGWKPAKWYGTLDDCIVVFDILNNRNELVANQTRRGRATQGGLLRVSIEGSRAIVDLRTMDIKLDKGTK